MVSPDRNVSLGRSYALPEGVRVRLRLAQTRDLAGIHALLSAACEDDAGFTTARLIRADPRRRVVVCAAALLGGSETIVGVGAIDLGADRPDLLCVDPELLGGLPELLSAALQDRVRAIGARSAA